MLTDAPMPFEPYHQASGLRPEEAERLIERASVEAEERALLGIEEMVSSSAGRKGESAAGIVISAGRPDFTLASALSSHAAMHSAEGWLFRSAVMRAAEEAGLAVFGALEDELYAAVSEAVAQPTEAINVRLRHLGDGLGPPWRQDQKLSALAAWFALLCGSAQPASA